MEDKREAKLLEKRYPANEELTQKIKGIAEGEPSIEELKYDDNVPQEPIDTTNPKDRERIKS